jgi:hypothetical protein
VSEEKQDGKGNFELDYYSRKYPIANVATTVNGAISADDGTITVVSTNGFPSSGSISINADRIDYTGKTATTFTGCTSVEAHDDASVVNSWVVEISNTAEGSDPAWTPITLNTDYDIKHDDGRIRLMSDDLLNDTTTAVGEVPQRLVPNRFRISYSHGTTPIDADVTHLTILVAAKKLFNAQILNSLSRGTNGFKADAIDDINKEIEKLVIAKKSFLMDNI